MPNSFWNGQEAFWNSVNLTYTFNEEITAVIETRRARFVVICFCHSVFLGISSPGLIYTFNVSGLNYVPLFCHFGHYTYDMPLIGKLDKFISAVQLDMLQNNFVENWWLWPSLQSHYIKLTSKCVTTQSSQT